MTAAMNLGILTASLSTAAGGMFDAIQAPANLLQKRGHEVSVYGIEDDRLPEARASWKVKQVQSFRPIGPARFGYARRLGKTLANEAFDVLHLHGLWNYSSFAASRWNRKNLGKLVISPHGMLDPWARHNAALKKKLVSWAYEDDNLRTAGAIRALCEAEARPIARLGLGVPIAIIPNGVTLPDLGATRTAPDRTRKTLLYLGRIHPKKGLAELIEGWSIAIRQSPALRDDWRLRIAGWDDGDHLRHLLKLVNDLALDHVEFVGPIYGEAKDEALAGCDAFVLPSRSEGMPMSVLEAWAYEKPVLMTEACNIPEGFAAGAAFRFDTEAKSIAAAVLELLDSPRDLREAGKIGRELVEARFTWDRVADQHVALFAWLTGGGDQPEFMVP
ncbi:MAG: glycosyltransferase [Sphingomonas sp.]